MPNGVPVASENRFKRYLDAGRHESMPRKPEDRLGTPAHKANAGTGVALLSKSPSAPLWAPKIEIGFI